MKNLLFAFTVLSGALAVAPNAHAQMAVIDAANLAQNLQTAAQSIAAVEQLRAQLSQLENTYTMFTNPTDILGMASGMENQAIENPMPLANSLSGLVGGQSSGNSAAITYYNQNHIYTAPAGTAQSTQLNQNAQGIANIEGIASTNLSAIEARLQQLPDLEADLNSATSITQVSAINGRIAAVELSAPPEQSRRTGGRSKRRLGARSLKAAGHQHQIAATAAGADVVAQLRLAGCRPLTALEHFSHFFFTCTGTQNHGCLRFDSLEGLTLCLRSRLAILRRARKSNRRMLADASPVTSAISRCV